MKTVLIIVITAVALLTAWFIVFPPCRVERAREVATQMQISQVLESDAPLGVGTPDAWGNPLRVELRRVVTSSGPDGIFGTKDDILMTRELQNKVLENIGTNASNSQH